MYTQIEEEVYLCGKAHLSLEESNPFGGVTALSEYVWEIQPFFFYEHSGAAFILANYAVFQCRMSRKLRCEVFLYDRGLLGERIVGVVVCSKFLSLCALRTYVGVRKLLKV